MIGNDCNEKTSVADEVLFRLDEEVEILKINAEALDKRLKRIQRNGIEAGKDEPDEVLREIPEYFGAIRGRVLTINKVNMMLVNMLENLEI